MDNKKPWYLSKTIWGIVIAAVGTVFGAVGIDVELPANADYNQIVAFVEAVKAAKGSWEAMVAIGMQAVGFLLAIYGRFTAEQKIGSQDTEGK